MWQRFGSIFSQLQKKSELVLMKSVRSFVSYKFFFTCKGGEDILIAGSCSDIVVGKDEAMELICLGDSLTYGYGVRSAQRWSTLVGQGLQCEVTKLGICGDPTGGMLVRLNTAIMPHLLRFILPTFSNKTAILRGGCSCS